MPRSVEQRVGRQGQEVGEVARTAPGWPARRTASPWRPTAGPPSVASSSSMTARIRAASTTRPSSSVTPCVRHCHSCDREISAVATSSMRSLMPGSAVATEPVVKVLDPDADVAPQPGLGRSDHPGHPRPTAAPALTETSSRRRCFWSTRSPNAASNSACATDTRSGWATQVPSKPSPASRSLSSRTSRQGSFRHLRLPPVRDEGAHAADGMRATSMAGLDQQLGVGAHERDAPWSPAPGRAAPCRDAPGTP